MKGTEEGDIWEWRGFGLLRDELLARVQSHPVRMGVINQQELDLYYPSPSSQHNVKLRRIEDTWALKMKPLLATGPRSVELYRESAQEMFRFPLSAETVHSVARMLGVDLSAEYRSRDGFAADELSSALLKASPSICQVPVKKVRSQYESGKAWIEVAQAAFPRKRIQSLSIHSSELAAVEELLNSLSPDIDFEPLNYVAACRRWA